MGSTGAAMSRASELVLAPLYLLACIILGGSSAGGIAANAALQAAGLLVIGLTLSSGSLGPLPGHSRGLLWIVGLAAALIAAQLVPLPPALWQAFPGRASISEGYRLIGVPPPWLPISLMVDGSIAALLSLIPPTAMLLATLGSSASGQRNAVYALIAMAAVSILLGSLQDFGAMSGFYEFTSFGAVGFFSNHNHLGTLCLMTLPFAAALAVPGKGQMQLDRRISRRLIAGSVVGLLTAGVIVVQSIACWILLGPMLFGCILIYQRGERGYVDRRIAWIASAILVVSLVAAVWASLSVSDLNQQLTEIRPRERRESMRLTVAAARDYLPLGSGFGSFVTLYPRYEAPADVSATIVNHAHNEYLELLLEGGLGSILLLAAFLRWWLGRLRGAWQQKSEAGSFARAGFLAVAVPLAHSLVDYPMRTAAIAAAAAFASGVLAAPAVRRSTPPARGRLHNRNVIVLTALLPPTTDVAGPYPG